MTKITQRERQIIFQMWKDGATQREITETLHVSLNTLRSELFKGFTGQLYIGGRRIYDPELAERNSGPIGRANYRKFLKKQEAGRIPPPQ